VHVFIYDICPSFYTYFLPFSCLITFTYTPSKCSAIFFSSPFHHYISLVVGPIATSYTYIYKYTHANTRTFIHFVCSRVIISPQQFTLLYFCIFILFYGDCTLFYELISIYKDCLQTCKYRDTFLSFDTNRALILI